MTTTLTPWQQRYEAFEKQNLLKSELCRPLVNKYLSAKAMPTPLGFTFEQYQAAYKTLVLALELFSPEENLLFEQLKLCQHETQVAKISMKLMWEDLCTPKPRSKEEETEYNDIRQLAEAKIGELSQLIEQHIRKSPSKEGDLFYLK